MLKGKELKIIMWILERNKVLCSEKKMIINVRKNSTTSDVENKMIQSCLLLGYTIERHAVGTGSQDKVVNNMYVNICCVLMYDMNICRMRTTLTTMYYRTPNNRMLVRRKTMIRPDVYKRMSLYVTQAVHRAVTLRMLQTPA